MKKSLAVTMTAALALGLAACGSHDTSNTSVDTTLANEDFAANDSLGNDTALDANATDGNTTSVEGNAL